MMKLPFLLIFLSVNLFSLTWDWYSFFSKSRLLLEKADRLYQEKRYDKATESYQEVLKMNPNEDKASFNLGNTYYRSEVLDKAKEIYESLAYRSKDNKLKENAFYNLANAYFKSHDYEKAIENYKNALRLDANDKEAKYNLELAMKNRENKKNEESSPSPENKKNSSKNQDKNESSPPSSSNQNQPKENNQGKPSSMTKEEASKILRLLDNKDRISTKYKVFSGSTRKSDEPW